MRLRLCSLIERNGTLVVLSGLYLQLSVTLTIITDRLILVMQGHANIESVTGHLTLSVENAEPCVAFEREF